MSNVWIQTHSRKRFDLLEPRVEDVDLTDIVRAICAMPRFTCQTEVPYTVGQHAILVALECWRRARVSGDDPRISAICGLHHDDAEAYTGDISAPMKRLLDESAKVRLRSIEETVEEAVVLPLLGGSLTGAYEVACRIEGSLVKPVDVSILQWEADTFLPGGRRHDWTPHALAGPLLIDPDAIMAAMPKSTRFAFYSLHDALVNGDRLPAWTGVANA